VGRFARGTCEEVFSGAYPLAAPLFAGFSGVNPRVFATSEDVAMVGAPVPVVFFTMPVLNPDKATPLTRVTEGFG
jgi:hypothetical protein